LKVAVAGLWHLGTVTAGCLASLGHEVVAYDENAEVVANLRRGQLPVAEPYLAEMLGTGVSQQHLTFTAAPRDLESSDALWICYDTPVNDDDVADVDFVRTRIQRLLAHLRDGAMVLISSQLPVGTTASIAALQHKMAKAKQFAFAYVPENLRLGRAVEVFTRPDRIVAGVGGQSDRLRIAPLLGTITDRIEWMSLESAEMTKHALNAFLATSVGFINEIACLCEQVGADALEVERGLKSDIRIGKAAYLHPGAAFAGGTLARDVKFLVDLSRQENVQAAVLTGVEQSNRAHRHWAIQRLRHEVGDVAGKTIAVLGLTYKAGTDTLRRSPGLEICRNLSEQGARVQAFDPAVRTLPESFAPTLRLAHSAEGALEGADAAIIATTWPEFTRLSLETIVEKMRNALVIDPARHLEAALGGDHRVHYVALGKGSRRSPADTIT
jgi:UDPglucose 6-dehydrogenase